ncbi:MAG: hypothetical protein ACE5OZ_18750 [Candidatus Heimdallarchaeota archaeon]
MILYYRQNRYNTYLFLIFATLFFLIHGIIARVVFPEEEPAEESSEATFAEFLKVVVPIGLVIITLMGALFFLVLFFQSFESSRVLTQTNLYLTLIFTVLTAGLLGTTLQLAISLPQVEGKTDDEIFESDSYGFIYFPMFVFLIFAACSGFFIVAMVIRIWLKLRRRIQTTIDPRIQGKLKKMRYAIIAILIAPMFGELFAILAFGYFIYLYSSSGTFILPAKSLQKFIIVGTEGMPLYSYNFQPVESESIPFDDRDVLFSGALRAISALFSEFTGKLDQALKEVTLENVVVMANQIADRRFLAVLLVEQSTRFFREAFDNVTEQLDHLMSQSKLHPHIALTIPQIQSMDQVIESNFGSGLQRNYDALS